MLRILTRSCVFGIGMHTVIGKIVPPSNMEWCAHCSCSRRLRRSRRWQHAPYLLPLLLAAFCGRRFPTRAVAGAPIEAPKEALMLRACTFHRMSNLQSNFSSGNQSSSASSSSSPASSSSSSSSPSAVSSFSFAAAETVTLFTAGVVCNRTRGEAYVRYVFDLRVGPSDVPVKIRDELRVLLRW